MRVEECIVQSASCPRFSAETCPSAPRPGAAFALDSAIANIILFFNIIYCDLQYDERWIRSAASRAAARLPASLSSFPTKRETRSRAIAARRTTIRRARTAITDRLRSIGFDQSNYMIVFLLIRVVRIFLTAVATPRAALRSDAIFPCHNETLETYCKKKHFFVNSSGERFARAPRFAANGERQS